MQNNSFLIPDFGMMAMKNCIQFRHPLMCVALLAGRASKSLIVPKQQLAVLAQWLSHTRTWLSQPQWWHVLNFWPTQRAVNKCSVLQPWAPPVGSLGSGADLDMGMPCSCKTCISLLCIAALTRTCIFLELYYDRGNHHEFVSLVKDLARPGEFTQSQIFDFEFTHVEKPYESYTGQNVKLR